VLLALVTALVVARPLVLGEDPGLTSRLSSTWGLWLSMLWLVTGIGWACWRAVFGRDHLRAHAASGVSIGLAAITVLVFISALTSAHYRHPALLIAWEWVVLLVAFCLVRDVTRMPADSRGLLAALVATGVSLSAYAIYQYMVELPALREIYADPEALRQALPGVASDNSHVQLLYQRLQQNNVFATFAHPNTFAGYLALLLPAAIGSALISWRRQGPPWRTLLLAGCALMLMTALWLTHSRGAILGSLMVGSLIAAGAWWFSRRLKPAANGLSAHHFLGLRRRLVMVVLAGLVGLAVVGVLGSRTRAGSEGLARAVRSFGLRTTYWGATWKMIQDYPWLGVGPGNFGRHYPRYMEPTASEKVQDPHNFALEIWATSGVFALLLLLITLAVFFRKTWHEIAHATAQGSGSRDRGAAESDGTRTNLDAADLGGSNTRWHFYLGGVLGLILGFVLRAADETSDEMVLDGMISLGRSLVWMGAFALLNSVAWPAAAQVLALMAGVAALLLNLAVSGGISQPAVAQPLWVAAALALSTRVQGSEVRSQIQQSLSRAGGFLVSLSLCALTLVAAVGYLLLVFSPVRSCARALAEARRHYGDKSLPTDPYAANAYFKRNFLVPLEQATRADPGDVSPPLELAFWHAEQWRLQLAHDDAWDRAMAWAKRAQRLDPDSKEGYLVEYRLWELRGNRDKSREKEYFAQAVEAARAVVARDPTEPGLHYRLAETLFLADDPVQARSEAEVARNLDGQATTAERSLTDPQRRQIRDWLRPGPSD
jgi:O-antigen ligase